ncbi:MAG: apolipoprotein N-acyltransferase [Rhodobacteraceae bacterium]|nr:apolipoprotein N-acyltransferase [Paracoccaceae bacterium]
MGLAARVGALKGWRQLLLALSAGAALGLVQAPWSFPLAFFAALPVIFWLHSGAISQRRAALVGWFIGLGYFGLILTWIVEPFLIDIASTGWMAPFALFFMAAGLALFWALAFWLASRGRTLLLIVLWSLTELARAYVFTGFPWGLTGYGWADTPIMQMASVVGVHGIGFLTMSAVALILRRQVVSVVSGALIFTLMWSFGTYQLSKPVALRADDYVVRIVQPNVDQKLKWLPEFQQAFFQRFLDLSANDGTPDIVIWPEAAVPFLPEERADLLQDISFATNGAEVIFGARRRDENGDWFNRLVLLNSDGVMVDSYDKHHLVPFGEYIPFQSILSKTGLTALTGTGWTPGPGPRVIATGNTPPFLPLICYEAIFPQYASVDGERAEWIVQITNDAWFGKFSGPYQHLVQARVRAIEQGLPLARSANTGVSVMVDPYGRVIDSLPLGDMGVIDVSLPAPLAETLYSRSGDWPIAVFLLLLTILQLIPFKRRQR